MRHCVDKFSLLFPRAFIASFFLRRKSGSPLGSEALTLPLLTLSFLLSSLRLFLRPLLLPLYLFANFIAEFNYPILKQ